MSRSWGRLGPRIYARITKKIRRNRKFSSQNFFFFEFRALDFESLEQALQPPERFFWSR